MESWNGSVDKILMDYSGFSYHPLEELWWYNLLLADLSFNKNDVQSPASISSELGVSSMLDWVGKSLV